MLPELLLTLPGANSWHGINEDAKDDEKIDKRVFCDPKGRASKSEGSKKKRASLCLSVTQERKYSADAPV